MSYKTTPIIFSNIFKQGVQTPSSEKPNTFLKISQTTKKPPKNQKTKKDFSNYKSDSWCLTFSTGAKDSR
jgi:hypothetical protein